MQLQFDKARWMRDSDGEWLCIRTHNGAQARQFVDSMRQKPYDAELKEHREKRSLDANAYCWVLLGKLAAHYALSPDEAYKAQIQNIGGNYEMVAVQDKAVDSFRAKWESNGIGWLTQTAPSKLPGCTTVRCYYGSSAYDTKQMFQLIDAIVHDCKDAGIETLPPDKLDAMKGAWDAKEDKSPANQPGNQASGL